MDDMYLDKMSRYENECVSCMQKAQIAYINNNFKHSKEECQYLQRAVSLRSEMARISEGSEKEFQKKKVHELNQKIAEIIQVIDPDFLRRKAEEAKKKASSSSGSNNDKKSSGENGGGSSESKVDEDEVASWFKEIPSISFDDVTGMVELKQRLRNCIADSRRRSIKEYMKIRKQKAYFFVGPPGCGKTYLIKAFAHELVNKEYKYMSLVGSDILSKYVGDAEKTITRLFEEAENNAPCIVFIDEIDGVCKNRSLENLPEYASSITTAFLTGYNRIATSDKPIIFIGATNYPNQVDNAMLDRVELINVPFPDKEGRILKFKQELGDIIELTQGFTYEEIGALTEATNEDLQYNYRDIERLTEVIKDRVIEEVMSIYSSEDDAIEALKSGDWGMSKEFFTKAQQKCQPTPKRSIIRELNNWQKQYEKDKE